MRDRRPGLCRCRGLSVGRLKLVLSGVLRLELRGWSVPGWWVGRGRILSRRRIGRRLRRVGGCLTHPRCRRSRLSDRGEQPANWLILPHHRAERSEPCTVGRPPAGREADEAGWKPSEPGQLGYRRWHRLARCVEIDHDGVYRRFRDQNHQLAPRPRLPDNNHVGFPLKDEAKQIEGFRVFASQY